LIETGVWRGGASIFMRAILKAYGDTGRKMWVADSFEGLPKPDPKNYPADAAEERKDAFYKFDQLAVSEEKVRENFARYGLLDAQVTFLKGWFRDTLPTIPATQRFAVIRLDGDLYESTWDAITALYPKLSVGGYCLIDDYGGIPACRAAVDDYRSRNGINEPIQSVDRSCVFWQKAG
jgi:O-methyltransferase